MEENKDFQEGKNIDDNSMKVYNYPKETQKNNWIKFALICLSVFLGSYLAIYCVADHASHHYISKYYMLEPQIFNKHFQYEQQRMLEDFERAMDFDIPNFSRKNKIVDLVQQEDCYKLIINLKKFNNNPKNVTLSFEKNKVTVSAKSSKSKGKDEDSFSFWQSYVLPESIDTKKVTTKKVGNKLIVNMPMSEE